MATDADTKDIFPIGSTWNARNTNMNAAQGIPSGAEFKIAYKCGSYISLYSTSFKASNTKVPRSLFNQNFERDYWKMLDTGFTDRAHYIKKYVADVSKLRS